MNRVNMSRRINSILILLAVFFSLLLNYCGQVKEKPKKIIDLSGENWTFHQSGNNKVLKAKVPGSVQMDLFINGEIPDPYYRTNENSLQWIGEKDWTYETTFKINSELLKRNNIEMVFKGLDTYTVVYINGNSALNADNFFREWKINAKPFLKEGKNSIIIKFTSPVMISKAKKKARLIPLEYDYSYTRKPAYHFGWDWGPIYITQGIWKPIIIEAWDNARILNMQIVQNKLTDKGANLTLIYEIDADKDIEADIIAECITNKTKEKKSVKLIKGINKLKLPFTVKNPKLWWTKALGEPNLYKFHTKLTVNGNTIDSINERIGLRIIKLIQKPDAIGKSFYFELNGVPVFMKGANYIPQDMFLNRPTKETYRATVKNAVDANMNMLRVWGGGFYENDIFYDLCDENGIMVWQDFMYACAMYPGDEDFLNNVKEETIQNVKRLRNHPSLALWCGNNENYIGWKDWHWQDRYSKEEAAKVWKDYEKLFEKLIPDVIKELDPDRFYWPSSPLFGWGYPIKSGGDVHYWGVWHGKEPFENFQKEKFIGRFMSEYGFQSCPEMSSIKKFSIAEDWDINSKVMKTHQKHRIGYPIIDKYISRYYKTPKDFKAYLYVSQIQQAFGIDIAIEAHRRAMQFCMGTLYWQLNDCYPVASWSSLDVYGKWKALHYKAREVYKSVLVSPFIKDNKLDIYIVSDKLKPIKANLELKLYDFSGKVLKNIQKNIIVKANSSHIYYSELTDNFLAGHRKDEILLVAGVLADKKIIAENHFFFVYPKYLKLSKAKIEFKSEKTDKGFELIFTTNVFAKEVFLSTENGEGFFTNNFFDIIPNIPVKITYKVDTNKIDIKKDLKIYSLTDSY